MLGRERRKDGSEISVLREFNEKEGAKAIGTRLRYFMVVIQILLLAYIGTISFFHLLTISGLVSIFYALRMESQFQNGDRDQVF